MDSNFIDVPFSIKKELGTYFKLINQDVFFITGLGDYINTIKTTFDFNFNLFKAV